MPSSFEQQKSALALATRELDQLRLLNESARKELAVLSLDQGAQQTHADHNAADALSKLATVLAHPSHNLHLSLTNLLLSVERLIDLDARDVPGVNEVIERQIQHLSSLVDDLIGLTQDALPEPNGH